MPKVCEACGQEGASKCCSGCKEAIYCSIACQTQHWKAGHKHKCVKAEKPSAATAAATAAAMATATPRPAAAGGAAQGSGGSASAGDEECAICLDALQQPQTMPCGHRFCRGCVASMRRHGAAVAQVCPLCRGAMPDTERLWLEAHCLIAQHERWKKGKPPGVPLPAAVQERLGKAVALCREALAIDPADAQAHDSLGYALNAGGDTAGAEAALRAAIAADPQHEDAHNNLGLLLLERGDKAGAEAACRAAIAADPQHARAHCNLGIVLGESGDHTSAARSFAAALKIDPVIASAKAGLQIALRMLKEERQR